MMNGWWLSHLTAVAPSSIFALVVSHLGSGILIQLGKMVEKLPTVEPYTNSKPSPTSGINQFPGTDQKLWYPLVSRFSN
jgi:hypothetical protein